MLYFLTIGTVVAVGGMLYVATEVVPRQRFKRQHKKHLNGLHQYDLNKPDE